MLLSYFINSPNSPLKLPLVQFLRNLTKSKELPTDDRGCFGAIQKVCHRPRGRGGSSKIVTNSDKGGGGSSQTVMSPLMIKLCDSFPNYWFSVINISYQIAFSLNLFLSNNKTFYIVTLTESEFRWGWG